MLKWAIITILFVVSSLSSGLYIAYLVSEDYAHNQHPSEEKKPELASDFDYSRPRYLEIRTKISNGIRFDLITRSREIDQLSDHPSSYQDDMLVIREDGFGKFLHAAPIGFTTGPVHAEFIAGPDLSEQFVIIREWTGGASCCYVHYVYTTEPELRRILRRETDFHASENPIVGKDKFEIHSNKNPTFTSKSHAGYQYNPEVIDLHKQVKIAFGPGREEAELEEIALSKAAKAIMYQIAWAALTESHGVKKKSEITSEDLKALVAEEYEVAGAPTLPPTPSFICEGELNNTEQVICGSRRLAHLDTRLADIYYVLRTVHDDDGCLEAQRAWLRKRDGACKIVTFKGKLLVTPEEVECLGKAYEARITELMAE